MADERSLVLTNVGKVRRKLQVVDNLGGGLGIRLETEREHTTVGVGSEELLGEFV
jgi:hypothetical protein